MAWIESHQELARHPKARRLTRLLGVSLPAVIGHLHCLWWWALDFAQDGEVTKYQADEIADGALWEGDPQAFVDALVQCGWLDLDEDGRWLLHDWQEYAGKLIDRRKSDADRKRSARQACSSGEGSASSGHPADVSRMSSGRLPDIHGTSDVTEQYPTIPSDPTVVTTGEGPHRERMASALPPRAHTPVAPASPVNNVVPLQPLQPLQSLRPPSPPRPPDVLWDACVCACGGVAPSNSVERGKWNKGLKALRESGATAEEIGLRAERYRRRYGESIALNPMALASNWSQLARDLPATEVTSHANTAAQQHYGGGAGAGGQRRGGSARSANTGRGNGGQGGYSGTYNPHLPDNEDFAEWARKRIAAGATNIIFPAS